MENSHPLTRIFLNSISGRVFIPAAGLLVNRSFLFPFGIDGPIFRQKPASVEADAGSVVSLVCDVDGNPTPDIVWIHDPTNRVCIS